MTSATNTSDYVLQVQRLSKAFPGVQALREVQLAMRPGEVHALMGENGAGKSTLMRILLGLVAPDAGVIQFRNRAVRFRNPHEALRGGLSMIHQELMLFPDLTVAENIFIGHEPATRWLGWMDRRAMDREAARLLERLGMDLPPARPVRELTVAEMQTVEIAKALAHDAELIIMDEPTSAISEREVEALFAIIRDLTRRGVAILYISHKLDEVFRIAATVTVLRDGQYVATRPVRELTRQALIALMVGRELGPACGRRKADPAPAHPPLAGARPAVSESGVALAVHQLSSPARFENISLEVHRGEVLGLAGLMGAGRTELVSALAGLAPARSGDIRVRNRPVRIRCVRDALDHGIALVSEDRQRYGLVPTMSVKQNLTLASLQRCCVGPWIRRRVENSISDERIQTLGIRTPGRDHPVALLSGGNQQKVVLAKALLNDPVVLLLDEPTRGIDIGAKAEIYAWIEALAERGTAILLISSELPELLALSDRLLVMRQGRITAELDPRRTTQEDILRHAMPETKDPHSA